MCLQNRKAIHYLVQVNKFQPSIKKFTGKKKNTAVRNQLTIVTEVDEHKSKINNL